MDEEFQRNLKAMMPTWPGWTAIGNYFKQRIVIGLVGVAFMIPILAVKYFLGLDDSNKAACVGGQTPSQQRITACNVAIETGTYSDKPLAQLFHARGLAHLNEKHDDNAVNDLTEAIRLSPNPVAFYNRGVVRLRTNDLDGAIADFGEAIERSHSTADAFFNRGIAYWRKNDLDRAIAHFSDSIRVDPKSIEGRLARGAAYLDSKAYDYALTDLNEAIRLVPKVAKGFYYRGAVYFATAKYDLAVLDFETALRLDPNLPNASIGLRRAIEALENRR